MQHSLPLAALVVSLIAGCSTHHPTPAQPTAEAQEEEGVVEVDLPDAAPAVQLEVPPPPQDLGVGDPSLLGGATLQLAVDIFDQLRGQEGNLALSPASISVAMAMTWGGAGGETAREIAQTFHFPEDTDALHASAHALLTDWNDPDRESYQLRVANRLFADQSFRLQPTFVALTRDRYIAPIEITDFMNSAEPSRVHINDWVASQTQDRIRDLLPSDSIFPGTPLVLTNAIYFRGTWRYRFPEDATRDQAFYLDGDTRVDVRMMHLTAEVGFASQDGARVLELPYVGDDLSMVVVLPEARGGLVDLGNGLTADRLNRWIDALDRQEVIIQLPRFRIDPPDSVALKTTLTEMGMPLAFTPGADFAQMSTANTGGEPIYIGDVFHKAFVEVNEEGTEAAAATAVTIQRSVGGGGQPPKPRFIADHPFLFLVRDTRSGAILFIGRVADPR